MEGKEGVSLMDVFALPHLINLEKVGGWMGGWVSE